MFADSVQSINCWGRQTRLEKMLSILVVVAIMSIILLAIILGTSKSNPEHGSVCLTSGCVKTAALVLADMDQTVDPCSNFYEFACGGFVRNTIIPEDRSSVTQFSKANDVLDGQMYHIIDQPVLETDAPPIRFTKQIFHACMNLTHIEELGIQPLVDQMESMGGWPTVKGDIWNQQNWTWQQAIVDFRSRGFDHSYILDFQITPDDRNNSNRKINFQQTSMTISRLYLIKGLDEIVVRSYFHYMVEAATLFGSNRDRAMREMRDVLDFEIAVAKISIPIEELRNFSRLNNQFYIAEADQRFQYVGGFIKYINDLLPATKTLSVTDEDTINIEVPVFYDRLGELLSNTPSRTLANYLFWRITEFSASYLNKAMYSMASNFLHVKNGMKNNPTRRFECLKWLEMSLPLTIGSLYVRNEFNQTSAVAATEIIEQIRAQFTNMIKNTTWMDDETISRALTKVKAMEHNIGYPSQLLLDDKLTEYYKLLEINADNYLESALSIQRFYLDKMMSLLRTPFNRTDWTTNGNVADVNAAYNPIKNSVDIPAGILQGKFFTIDRPRYMNFGSIGYVMGHEITHGFDDEGRQFDENGNLANWWQPETLRNFLERAQCIINQYGNYTDEQTKLKLNGINTQGENIADNAGFKISYEAYKAWELAHQPEQTLPGLPYTQRQLFWISASQTFCSVVRTESMKEWILTDPHSPGVFRVLGSLQNIPAFAGDFNCPIETPMNPAKKCALW